MSDIEEILRKRLKKSSFPQFWYPQKVGDEISGRIIRIRNSPWPSKTDYDKFIYEVQPFQGEPVSLPLHAVLMRMLAEEGVKVGDYILVRYVGEVKSRGGRAVKSYEVAVLPSEEVAAAPTPTPAQPAPPTTPQTAPTPPPTQAAVTSPPAVAEEEKPKLGGKLEEIKKFVDELFSYYDSLTIEEFDYYLNTIKKWSIDPAIVIKELGLKVEGNKVTK